jgi:DNA-binding response OmpR family regulator
MKKRKDNGKILIVDDDPLNIDIIKEIIGDRYYYKVAYSGTEALEIAENFHADVILLDIMMPDIDGYEVCRRCRNNEKLSLTKIILISAKQMLEDRLEGYRAGADDYLTKPFEPAELLAKIQVFLRLKSIEEIERIKSDLISVFSHETRTPLHAILGFAQLLLDKQGLPQNEKEALLHIKRSGEDMLELVDKTILLSNLRDGSKALKRKKILLSRLLEMGIARVVSEAKYNKVNITIENDSDIVVNVDEQLILTAISCILKNSFKYAEKDSDIKVSINDESEDGCSIIITTMGTALPDEKLPTLFSEFTVEDVSHHGRGTGLDLSIVKNIIELHQGAIQVLPNSKTRTNLFILTFPSELIVLEDFQV